MKCSACGGARVMPKGGFRYGRCNRCKGTGLERTALRKEEKGMSKDDSAGKNDRDAE